MENYQGGAESVQTLHSNSTVGEQYMVRQNDCNITDMNSQAAENHSLNQISNNAELNLTSDSSNIPQDKSRTNSNKLGDVVNLKKHASVLFQENIQKNPFINAITSRFKQNIDPDVLDFMIGVMDECTYLGNFTKPVDTSLIIIVHAKQDAYIPRGAVPSLEDLWPGSEVRFIDTGHVIACAGQHSVFR